MSKKVIYWTGTGNTEIMAELIGKGIEESGGVAEVLEVSDATVDMLKDDQVFALGCPSMGDEVLEENTMEPFVEELCAHVSGKKIALFGSYGWGDGEWMRNWEERMSEAGATIISGEGLIINGEPDEEGKENCINLGRLMAE